MKFISTKTTIDANRTGHFGPITCVEWSPDGTRIATGSYDGRVIIWKPDLSVERVFSHTRLVNGVRWSRDGRFLGVACGDGHCHIWNSETGACESVLSRHTDDVNTIAWSPNGETLVTVSEDGTGRLWDRKENELIANRLIAHSNHCMSVDFHPEGNLIASCGEDATIRIWNGSGELVAEWSQPGDLEMVRWSPNGTLLASACDDSTVRVLDRQGNLVKVLGPHSGAVKSVSWSPDSSLLASGSYDLAVSLWSIDTGLLLATIQHGGLWPRGLHWSPNTPQLVVGTQTSAPTLLNIGRGSAGGSSSLEMLNAPVLHTCGVNAVRRSHSDILAGIDDGTIRVWKPDLGQSPSLPVTHSRGDSLVNAIDVDEGGNNVCYGTFAGDVGVVSNGRFIALHNVGAPINSVKWRGSDLIAVVDYRGRLTFLVFEDSTLRSSAQYQPHDGAIKSISWLDDQHIITGATDRTIRVVDVAGKTHAELRGHGNLINSVDVSKTPSGRLVASASRDRTVRIWDPYTARCIRVLVGHTESVKAVSWKPDSYSELASGSYDFDVRAWTTDRDEAEPEYSRTLSFHEQGVSTIDWSAIGLVSGSWDGSVALWNPDVDHSAPARTFNVPIRR